MVDVRAYLESKSLLLKPAGANEVHTACFYCKEDTSKRGRLYINVDPNGDPPGLFMCHLCDERGALNKLRKYFGDPPLRDDEVPEVAFTKHAVLQASAQYYHDLLADHEDVYDFLRNERGLTLETIQAHQLGWADGSLGKYLRDRGFKKEEIEASGLVSNGRDFLINKVTIPYYASGNVVSIRGKEIGGKYLTVPGDKTRLFNIDRLKGASQAIITEGEFDALVLEQLGYNAVGQPGASAWQENWKVYFEEIPKVYIVFDNDSPGQLGAEKVAKSLGAKTRNVRMPDAPEGEAKNDPSEWIVKKHHNRDDFHQLLVQAKGGYLLTVDEGYHEWREMQDMEGLTFGIRSLDSKITPGLLPSQVMVVLAKTGTGKTVFTLNLFHRLFMHHPDAKVLFVSLEQTRGEWFERARRIYRFYNPEATDLDCLPYYRDRLMIIDKNRVTEEELLSSIEQFEFEMGSKPSLVAVDYLGYWARAYKGEPYERTSKAIMALKAIAKDSRIAFLTPHQVSRVAKFGEELEADSSRDSGVVEETADFMLGLWAEDSRKGIREDEKTGRVVLKIAKSRHGGAGSRVSLQFAPLSLAMVPIGDDHELEERARVEHDMAARGDDFETATFRHATLDTRSFIPPEDVKIWYEALCRRKFSDDFGV